MKFNKFIVFFIILIFFSSCSNSSSKNSSKQELVSPAPIVEIRERINLSLPDAFDMLGILLSRYDLYIPEGLSNTGTFSTTSIKIKDKICKAQFLNKAPVTCDLKFFGTLQSINSGTTSLSLSYRQNCIDQRHIPNVCKNSNAEKLLFKIHNELKARN